jgi:hypothetical protein
MKHPLLINWSAHLGLCWSHPWADGHCIGFELFLMFSIPGVDDHLHTHQLLQATTPLDEHLQHLPFPLREQAARKRLIIGKQKRKIRYTSYGSGGNYYWENYTILRKDFPHLLNCLRNSRALDLSPYDEDFMRLVWHRVQTLDRRWVNKFLYHLASEHLKDLARRRNCTTRELFAA